MGPRKECRLPSQLVSHPASTLPSAIFLVRHGATTWSASGQHTGRTDLPLTDDGVAQARSAGRLLRRLLGDADPLVFTSPLQRARRTASLMLPDSEPVIADALTEWDYGAYEGLTSEEIVGRSPGWELFRDGCPGGEAAPQVAARCASFTSTLERVAGGRAVVAFTHGHLSRAMTAVLIGLPIEAGAGFQNDTASIAEIAVKRGRFVLDGWNLRAGPSA